MITHPDEKLLLRIRRTGVEKLDRRPAICSGYRRRTCAALAHILSLFRLYFEIGPQMRIFPSKLWQPQSYNRNVARSYFQRLVLETGAPSHGSIGPLPGGAADARASDRKVDAGFSINPTPKQGDRAAYPIPDATFSDHASRFSGNGLTGHPSKLVIASEAKQSIRTHRAGAGGLLHPTDAGSQ
jgi:hypothetical protein